MWVRSKLEVTLEIFWAKLAQMCLRAYLPHSGAGTGGLHWHKFRFGLGCSFNRRTSSDLWFNKDLKSDLELVQWLKITLKAGSKSFH